MFEPWFSVSGAVFLIGDSDMVLWVVISRKDESVGSVGSVVSDGQMVRKGEPSRASRS